MVYSVSMKTWVFLAAAVLTPMIASAQATPINESVRLELIKEIEADRIALLPQTEPLPAVTVKHQPRLNEIKAAVVAAKAPAQITKARKDLADWKSGVMRALYADDKRSISSGETLTAFTARRENEVKFVMALRQQFAAQKVEAEANAVRMVSRNPSNESLSLLFDHKIPGTGSDASYSDGSVKVVPLEGAARFKKVRDIAVNDWKANPRIVDAAINEAMRQNVDPALVLAVIYQESRFSTKATSPVGARGLMQIMPSTGKGMGVANPDDLYDMQTNLRLGVRYLRNASGHLKLGLDLSDISTATPEKLRALLASYNAGCGAVGKWLKEQGGELITIPYNETRNYARAIAARLGSLKA